MRTTRITGAASTYRVCGALLAAAALLAVAPPADAQTVDGLRLATRDGAINGSVLDRAPLARSESALTEAPAPSSYVPQSEGAVADEELRDPPLYGETDSAAEAIPADPFQLDRRPETPRLPLGAAARRTQAAEASAADRPREGEESDRDTADASAAESAETDIGRARTASLPERDEERNRAADADSIRTGTVDGQRPAADDDPFAAVGIRAGSFILKPSLETGITATSNVDSAAGGGRGILSETMLRLEAASDWLRHAATLDASLVWEHPISPSGPGEPEIEIDGTLRLDLAGDYELNAAAGYRLAREAADSPVAIPATADRPFRHSLAASAGIAKSAGKLRYSLTGDLDRDVYSDADLAGGGTLSQRFRNNTLATATLRAGYEISPAVVPFAEVQIGRRIYDQTVDPAGFRRSANRLALRGGTEFDFGEKLTGEVAVGWLRESFDDPLLAAISGASVDASLIWSPQRGTTVTLSGDTTVEQSTTGGSSGSILHQGSVSVEHALRTNVTGTASLTAGLRNFAGTDDRDVILTGELGFTWWLNRSAGLTGRARHERLTSTIADRSYGANSVYLGLRLQR